MTVTNGDSTRVLDSIAMVIVPLLHVLENLETKLWNNIMVNGNLKTTNINKLMEKVIFK